MIPVPENIHDPLQPHLVVMAVIRHIALVRLLYCLVGRQESNVEGERTTAATPGSGEPARAPSIRLATGC